MTRMPSADLIKLAVTALTAGFGLIATAIKRHNRFRKVADTARSKIATAPQGYVEFQGFAWPAGYSSVRSQNGHESVYYSFELQKSQQNGVGKRGREWVTIYSSKTSTPFYLVDATGVATIRPAEGELDVEEQTRGWYYLNQKEKDRILNDVVKDNVPDFPPSSFLFGIFGGAYQVVEKEIRVGSSIYASGNFRAEKDTLQSPGLSNFAKRVFNEKSRGLKNVKHLLDRNGDGVVTAEEAREGYALAAQLARFRADQEKQIEPEFQVWGQLGSSEVHQLYVADAFEEHVKARLSDFLWTRFAGGAALLALGVFCCFGEENLLKTFKFKREPASIAYDIQSPLWHQGCINGAPADCESLLSHKNELNLSPEQIHYYRTRSCDLGNKFRCR